MNNRESNQAFRALPQPQKIAVITLAFLGIAVVVFWIFEFRAQLRRPFNLADNSAKSSVTSPAAADPRTTDTDGDGLSDYDEVNVYHTSPYLEDTDGDGISDGQEVKNGTDPNCPEGKVCNVTTPLATSTAASPTVAPTESSAAITGLGSGAMDQTTLQNLVGGQMDAATLRQILIQSGADKASLDKISDADLMKSYQETLTNQNKQ